MMILPDGNTYEGMWKANLMHGFGVYTLYNISKIIISIVLVGIEMKETLKMVNYKEKGKLLKQMELREE